MALQAKQRSQRDQTAGRVLSAALKLFVDQGYQATTVEQVAESCGMTKSSVYFYFKTKSDLMMGLLDEVEEVFIQDTVQRISNAGPSAKIKLLSFFDDRALLNARNVNYVLLMILMSLEFHHGDDPISKRIKMLYRQTYRTVEGVIEMGKMRGNFSSQISTVELAAMMVAMRDGVVLEWHRRRSQLDGKELMRSLQASLLGEIEDAGARSSSASKSGSLPPGQHP